MGLASLVLKRRPKFSHGAREHHSLGERTTLESPGYQSELGSKSAGSWAKNRNVWTAGMSTDYIDRLNPLTGTFMEVRKNRASALD